MVSFLFSSSLLQTNVNSKIDSHGSLGIPVTNVAVTSDTEPLWDGTSCSGYSWTTTYDAGTEAEYTNVEVRLSCQTGSGVPFSVLEQGTGKNASTTLRRIVSAPPDTSRESRTSFVLRSSC
jgi:hypothetical protein